MFPRAPSVSFPVMQSIPEMAFESLQREVQALEESLVEGEDVMGLFVSFGATSLFAISQIRLAGQTICFHGIDDNGREVRVLQHYSQVNLLLVKDKAHREIRNPIGFLTGQPAS